MSLAPSLLLTLLAAALGLMLGGCATTRPVAYSGLASHAQLQPNHGDDATRTPYVFATDVDWSAYSQAIVESASVYRGRDAQFEKLHEADKRELARHMEEAFRERLRQRFRLVPEAGPGALRIRLTLTGAKPTKQVVGTILRFDLAGGSYNLVQSARGREGALSGWVSYAVEIYDSASGRLLSAYVAKQYPNAMNVKATVGALAAAKVGLDKGADDLLERLN